MSYGTKGVRPRMQPTLTTSRLRLRPFELGDGAPVQRLAGDVDVREWPFCEIALDRLVDISLSSASRIGQKRSVTTFRFGGTRSCKATGDKPAQRLSPVDAR